MAAVVRRHIERGTATMTTTATTLTVTLATTLLDLTKSILLISLRSASTDYEDYAVCPSFVSTTQIKFERSGTPLLDCIIQWQVIEFTQGVTCHQYLVTQSATSVNTAITSVDTTKAFPIVYARTGAVNLNTNSVAVAEITTATNLQTRSTGSAASFIIYVQIIQFDDSSIQKFVTTYGTGTTKDITVSSITENKTFWFFSVDAPAQPVANDLPYLAYINATTLRFTRIDAAGVNFNLVVYVVSMTAGVTVQNISTVIASSGTSVSPSIATVVVDRTTIHQNGIHQAFAAHNAAGDDGGGFCFALSGLTTSAFTATRTDAPAINATTNVQVIEWADSAGAVTSAGRKTLLGVGI